MTDSPARGRTIAVGPNPWDTGQKRVAVVTGASSGVGRAVAAELGRLGWAVAVGARRVERLEVTKSEVEAAGGTSFAQQLDVSDAASVNAFFAAAEDALGPVDVLISNAGVVSSSPFVDIELDELRRVLETNFIGGFHVAQHAVRGYLERGVTGDVVFISSSAATDPWPQQLSYGTSKAALDSLARGLQLELEGTGIRVTTVRIGATESEIGTTVDPEKARAMVEVWQSFGILRNVNFIPTEQVARTVAFVVSAPPEILFREVEVAPVPGESLDWETIERKARGS